MTHTIERCSSGIQPLKSLVACESDEEGPANYNNNNNIIHQLSSLV